MYELVERIGDDRIIAPETRQPFLVLRYCAMVWPIMTKRGNSGQPC
jgi:hypothetical protein